MPNLMIVENVSSSLPNNFVENCFKMMQEIGLGKKTVITICKEDFDATEERIYLFGFQSNDKNFIERTECKIMKATQYPTRCIPSECHSVSKDKKDSPYLAVVADVSYFNKIVNDLIMINCGFGLELHVVGAWQFKNAQNFHIKIFLQEYEVEYFNLIINKLRRLGVSRDKIQSIIIRDFIPAKKLYRNLSL